jgi:uncharacterized protein
MEFILIAICSLLAAFMSFYSGFGLGTVLMPIMAIFLPIPLAISLTAIVHLLQNLFKTGLLWKAIDWSIAMRFGGVAMLAALPGAWILRELSSLPPLVRYSFFGVHANLSVLSLLIGSLLIVFATMEILSAKWIRTRHLFVQGALSGFFGGLSGNQGAFRSLFLIHSELDTNAFIGTNAVIASAVDMARVLIYGFSFISLVKNNDLFLLGSSILGCFAGILIGSFCLKKVTIHFIRKLIVFLLYILGFLLMVGVI